MKKYEYLCNNCEESTCIIKTNLESKPSVCINGIDFDYKLIKYLEKYRLLYNREYDRWKIQELTGKSICTDGFWYSLKENFNSDDEAIEFMLKQK